MNLFTPIEMLELFVLLAMFVGAVKVFRFSSPVIKSPHRMEPDTQKDSEEKKDTIEVLSKKDARQWLDDFLVTQQDEKSK